ncbi:hypothetical protein ABT256_12545 [Amycolatopsis japonica]|uniref:hypothetical protein n=1 Tax=Amycolatopsis japonica TaxID=208439 RepID=UPI00332C8739
MNAGDDTEPNGSLYDRTSWRGTSCLSHLWPYASDQPLFETKRAVANLTGGLRHTFGNHYLGLNEEDAPSASDVLHFARAAKSVEVAIDKILHEVVAEAVSRGATWKQVGDALEVGRTAAHKRFGKGLTEPYKEELEHQGSMRTAAYCFWTGIIDAENLGHEDADWEVTPPEVAVDYAIRSAVKASALFAEWFASQDEEDPLKGLRRVYEIVRHSYHVLSTPKALETIVEFSRNLPSETPWTDINAPVYFMHGITTLACVFRHLTKLWQAVDGGLEKEFRNQITYAYYYFNQVSNTFVRPECTHVMALMEEKIVEAGHFVSIEPNGPEDEGLQQEMLDAIWRKDKAKTLELTGESDVEFYMPSLDELLRRQSTEDNME